MRTETIRHRWCSLAPPGRRKCAHSLDAATGAVCTLTHLPALQAAERLGALAGPGRARERCPYASVQTSATEARYSHIVPGKWEPR